MGGTQYNAGYNIGTVIGQLICLLCPIVILLVIVGIVIYVIRKRKGLSTNITVPNAVKGALKGPERVDLSLGRDWFPTEVKGESNYQSALESICGKRKTKGENRIEYAELVYENNNKADINAVKFMIKGR